MRSQMGEASPDVPAGFWPHWPKSGLTDPWEPLYSRRTAEAVFIGFRAGLAHSNSRGFVHGGLISALADNAMGLSCGHALGNVRLVTVNLTRLHRGGKAGAMAGNQAEG